MPIRNWQLGSGLRTRWGGSVRFRHTVGLCVVIVLIMGIGSGLLIYQTENILRRSAEERGLALTRAFAVTGATAVRNNLFVIQEAIQKSFRDPDVLHIDIIDSANMIIASKHVERIGTVLDGEGWLSPVQPQAELLIHSKDANGQPILVIVEPLFAQRQLTAWLRLVMSLAHVQETEWQTVERMLLVTLALIAAGIIGVHVVQRHVSSVLHTLIGQLNGALCALGMSPTTEFPRGSAQETSPRETKPGQGEIEYLTDVATQTTELVKTQSEALRESELKFRTVTQSASDAIVSADAGGHIISWNRGARVIFGYEEEEAIGKPVTMLMPDRYRELCDSGQQRVHAAEKPHLIGTTRELQGLRNDGTTFPLELSLATWETGDQRYFTAIIRDVTERKRAEEAQRRLVAILEATTDFVGIADKDGRALYLNRAGRSMLGLDGEEDISHTTIAHYHPEWVATLILEEGLPQAIRHGVWAGETALLTRDGREIAVSQVILAHKTATGAVEFFSTIARDMTDRQRAQEALEKLAESLEEKVRERTAELEVARDYAVTATRHKSEFLANMSHELRTPLNAVIGFSEVLLERMFGDINAKQEEYLQDILTSGRHLLALINDILDLAKIEAGRTELELTTFNLPVTLENTLTLVRERAMRHSVNLSSEIDSQLGDCTADERKVRQVLLNLLSNAIKFTPEGGSISLTATARDAFAEISITDTGVGIGPEDQPKIFQEFYRAQGDLVKTREGTGLGLALARKYVELHGGSIWLESQVGQGSTFTFTLPLRNPVEKASVAMPGARDTHHDRPLALVVEDDPHAAKLLSIYLKEAGFGVELASSGEAGLEKVRALRPAVITLDILMHEVDGWDFLSLLKADPHMARIPVIIVSILDERGKGFSLGAAEYLVKPVDGNEVIAAVRRVTKKGVSDGCEATVLVVDDDPMALELMQALLQPHGFTVLKAGDGQLGLRLAREHRPHLIVLDLLMPDVDGFQVLDELKRDPVTQPIPVVVLTSKTLTPDEKRVLNGRIKNLVQKGQFSAPAFVAQIRSLVEPEALSSGDEAGGS